MKNPMQKRALSEAPALNSILYDVCRNPDTPVRAHISATLNVEMLTSLALTL